LRQKNSKSANLKKGEFMKSLKCILPLMLMSGAAQAGYVCKLYETSHAEALRQGYGNIQHTHIFYTDENKKAAESSCRAKMEGLILGEERTYLLEWIRDLPENWQEKDLMDMLSEGADTSEGELSYTCFVYNVNMKEKSGNMSDYLKGTKEITGPNQDSIREQCRSFMEDVVQVEPMTMLLSKN